MTPPQYKMPDKDDLIASLDLYIPMLHGFLGDNLREGKDTAALIDSKNLAFALVVLGSLKKGGRAGDGALVRLHETLHRILQEGRTMEEIASAPADEYEMYAIFLPAKIRSQIPLSRTPAPAPVRPAKVKLPAPPATADA